MRNYDEMYKSYVQKCKELGIAPSSKDKMFGKQIRLQKQEQHVSIATLSQAKKQEAPVLSEIAREALVVPKKRKPKLKKIAASNKKYRDEVRTPEQLEEKNRKAREYRQKNL